MDPTPKRQTDRKTGTPIDPWDPNGPMLAVMRIRAGAVSVADDAHESVTYTRPKTPARTPLKIC